MSISTIYIKKPLNFRPSVVQVKDSLRGYNNVLTVLLWAINILYSSSKTSFSAGVSGLTVTIPVPDVLLISLSTMLLYKGLENKNVLLTVPWILLTACSIYFYHYKGIMNILSTLKHVTKLSWLPWSALVISVVLLFVRLVLMIKILQLCANLWFKQKIEELNSKK